MKFQTLIRCSLGLAIVTGVFAQSKPSNPSPTPTAPSRGNSTTTIPMGPSSGTDSIIQRPLLITGKVQMDDGSPLPDAVLIQLVCRASPRNIGYTDRKGSFGIDLNDRATNSMYLDASQASQPGIGATNGQTSALNNSSLSTASSSGIFGTRDYLGCDVRASMPGFRSDDIHLDARRSMDNPEIGTIFLHRLGNVEGLTISATSTMAPKDAKKSFDKGRADMQKGKSDDAQKEFEKAVGMYPKFAEAWYYLGLTQEDKKNVEEARKSFAQALDADAKYVNPYLELASIDMREQKWQDAADISDRVMHLNPVDFPQAYYFNAFANFNLQKFDLAEKSAKDGLSRDTAHKYPRMSRILAVIMAQRQDYTGAAEQLRAYLQFAPTASDVDIVKKQLAEIDKSLEAQKQQQQ